MPLHIQNSHLTLSLVLSLNCLTINFSKANNFNCKISYYNHYYYKILSHNSNKLTYITFMQKKRKCIEHDHQRNEPTRMLRKNNSRQTSK